jgi:hypothetical protein
MGRLEEKGLVIDFAKRSLSFNGTAVGSLQKERYFYSLFEPQIELHTSMQENVVLATQATAPKYIWHRRMAHLGYQNLDKLSKHSTGIIYS